MEFAVITFTVTLVNFVIMIIRFVRLNFRKESNAKLISSVRII